MLNGFAVCGECRQGRGGLTVRSRVHGKGRFFYYRCAFSIARGPQVCANTLPLPMKSADQAVLATLRHDLLRPEVLEAALKRVHAALTAPGDNASAKRRSDLTARVATLDTERANLTEAIARGGGGDLDARGRPQDP